MKMSPRFLKPFGASLLMALLFFSQSALAQFSLSDGKLFIGVPEFQVERDPGQQYEIAVYAIIDDRIAFYTIYSANRFDYAVLGTFQCNVEFSLMKSSSNGLYDIRCTDNDVFNEPTTYIIKYNGSEYVQDFSAGK